MSKERDLNYEFLVELSEDTQARGLAASDKLLLPETESNHQATLKIVEEDLAQIKNP